MSVSSLTGRTTWEEVWRSQMVLLGKSYQRLLARGAPPSAPASASSSASQDPQSNNNQQQASFHGPTSLRPQTGQPIFLNQRPAVPPIVSSILSAPPAAASAPAPRAPAPPPSLGPTSQVPSIFTQHSLPPTSAPAPTPAPAPRGVAAAGGVWALVQKIGGAAWSVVPGEAREAVENQLGWLRRVEGRELGRGLVRRSLGVEGQKGDSVLVMQSQSSPPLSFSWSSRLPISSTT